MLPSLGSGRGDLVDSGRQVFVDLHPAVLSIGPKGGRVRPHHRPLLHLGTGLRTLLTQSLADPRLQREDRCVAHGEPEAPREAHLNPLPGEAALPPVGYPRRELWAEVPARGKRRLGEGPTKAQLCSLAGVIPRADNRGPKVSQRRSVKWGDMASRRFLRIAVQAMLQSKQDTTIKRLYAKKAKTIGASKAQAAAARELAPAIPHLLTHEEPYRDSDTEPSERKLSKMKRTAAREVALPTAPDLESLDLQLASKAVALVRLARENACTA